MVETRKAVGWFLLGLVLTTVLVNALGFASPVWALATSPDSATAIENSRGLLDIGQAVVPWTSLIFVVAVWYVAQSCQRFAARAFLLVLGALLAIFFVLPAHLPLVEDSPVHLLAEAFQFLVLLLCTYIVWRKLQSAT